MKRIRTVGVLGCGLMGSGIAEVAMRAGFATIVREVSDSLADAGRARIEGSLGRAVERGKLGAEERDEALGRLSLTVDVAPLADAALILEAIVENAREKRKTFSAVEEVASKRAIFATNTSSLTVTELAMSTGRPERFIGLHFFNPVPVMRLVEVVRTLATDKRVLDHATSFVRDLGKEPIACRDRSGFIVNRLLVPYMLDAVRALENGVGTVEDIDRGMKLGCGHPMGPFRLLDFVGLDTVHEVANIMFDEYRETRFAPPPLLKRMVRSGRLGKKSGRGFYDDYTA